MLCLFCNSIFGGTICLDLSPFGDDHYNIYYNSVWTVFRRLYCTYSILYIAEFCYSIYKLYIYKYLLFNVCASAICKDIVRIFSRSLITIHLTHMHSSIAFNSGYRFKKSNWELHYISCWFGFMGVISCIYNISYICTYMIHTLSIYIIHCMYIFCFESLSPCAFWWKFRWMTTQIS